MSPSVLIPLLTLSLVTTSCSREVQSKQGDLAVQGGSATVRQPHAPLPDDPRTTNDESNDQPLGHFGVITIVVTSEQSGNSYTLDADVIGSTVSRIYFPKGGWVDFVGCDVDEALEGECLDEQGRNWMFEGPAPGYPSANLGVEPDNDEMQEEEEEDEQQQRAGAMRR